MSNVENNKLHIFGASGSGVTTLVQLLANQSGIKYFEGDDYTAQYQRRAVQCTCRQQV